MTRTIEARVKDGQAVIPDLPFPDGHLIQVTYSTDPRPKLSIEEVREKLRGSVTWHCDPTEPMIPESDWDVLNDRD